MPAPGRPMHFVIKTEIEDVTAETFSFPEQKTMYGGKRIANGDVIFIFASETQGGPGLIASGVVTSAVPVAPVAGVARQTPRVSITVRRTASARRPLGRRALRGYDAWDDGRPETELQFKLYRQATNKIVGISDEAAAFLRGYVEDTAVDLYHTDRGRGEAFVFLHYFAGSSRAWDAVVARLAPRHRCIAVDLRGFGDSPAPETGYAVGDSADDVGALIAALALEEYVLVGHSMGGKIAMALAARRPPGLARLVLVAPSPPTPEPMPDATRSHLLASFGDRESAVATAHGIAARRLSPLALEQVVADTLRTSRPAWDAWLREGSREDISAAVSAIDVPTLVVAGGNDPVMHRDMLAREVRDRIAGARMVVVPSVGHLVPYEAPDALARLIGGER